MGIPITGLFEPSGGAGSFDLYSPADIEAGNINVILQAIAGGAFKGGSHADTPVGEVVIQVRTDTGAPTHSASLGTPCWNSTDLLLYVNNDGSTGWTLVRYTDAEVDAIVATHAAAADPHTGYQKESEKDAASGYAGLTAGTKLNLAQMQEVIGYADLTDDLAILKTLLTTRGDIIYRNATVPARLGKGTAGQRLTQGADDPAWAWEPGAIEYVIDGGGAAIATGSAGGLVVPFGCFVTGWEIHATGGQSGAMVVDVFYHATTVPATASIAGTELPTLATTQAEDLTLTTWTQALAKSGSLVFSVVSNVGAHERVVVCLYVDKGRAA